MQAVTYDRSVSGRLELKDAKKGREAAQAAEEGVRALLTVIGEDPSRDGLLDTPARVVKAFAEMTVGYHQDPKLILAKEFDVQCDSMIVLDQIAFTSLCEHHLLPFIGVAKVAYVPTEKIVGLSKLARLVDCYALRLQVQERLTQQIASALQEHLMPRAVGVVVKAHHQCMSCRGVRKAGASMTTSALLGDLKTDAAMRAEFLAL